MNHKSSRILIVEVLNLTVSVNIFGASNIKQVPIQSGHIPD
jgi:hypothetical protein